MDGLEDDRVIAVIATGRGRQLRISLARFRGEPVVTVGMWFRADNQWMPIQSSLFFDTEQLPDAVAAFAKAMIAARSMSPAAGDSDAPVGRSQ